MSNKFNKIMDESIDSFNRDSSQTQIFFPIIDHKKYFLKVAGKNRSKYSENEIKSLKKLQKISPFYQNYYIASKTKDEKTALLLKYIEGEDLSFLMSSKKLSLHSLIKLYKTLLRKIKVYHDNKLTHGDIKDKNFFNHLNDDGEIEIELIDTESVNDFSKKLKEGEDYKNIITRTYDFPIKIKRSKICFSSLENAFAFYRYVDIYCVSILIFYLYRQDVYKLVRNDKERSWDTKRPNDYLDNKNKLEKALSYVFSFLSYLNEKKCEIPTIPLTVDDILKKL